MILYQTLFASMLLYSTNCFATTIIGHRGACGYEPENTLRSFQKGIDLGSHALELDVFVCATGELVVIHDDTVDRTTNGHGNVVDMSFEQLRKLVIEKNERIPTLQEVIDLVNRQIPINIELKGPGTAEPVAALVKQYLQKGWNAGDFIISSFDHAEVATFKRLCPEIKTGILVENETSSEPVQVALHQQANVIGINHESVSKQLVDDAHKQKLEVFVYTVNNKKLAEKLIAMGVDGIFSDSPDQIR